MPLSDFHNRMQEDVLSQNIDGTYIKRRPSQSSKIILGLGIVNLALAISSFYSFFNTFKTLIPYSQDTSTAVFLPKGTNYLYISLEGVYQNYLSYTKSINYKQLNGNTTGLKLGNTAPFDYNGDLPYYPAGAIAATYFQDEIAIENLEIQSENIARSVDVNLIGFTLYLPNEVSIPENWTSSTNQGTTPLNTFEGSGLPVLNERFVNWIAIAPFSNFKKLWGVIEVPESGEYLLSIKSNYEIAKKKSIFITQKNVLGIPNYYACAVFFVTGVFCILSSVYLSKYGY